jgi:hypothetical protein
MLKRYLVALVRRYIIPIGLYLEFMCPQRYAIIAENGKVTHLSVEDEVTDVKKTKAEKILSLL